MSQLRSAVIVFACGALVGTVACNKTPAADATPAASAAASATASSAPAVAPAKAKPWFSGGFSGEYQAKVATVDVKVGAIKEWSKDDGKLASGPGKLTLQIDDAGQVDGTSEGALGAGHVSGKVDGDGFKGSIEASSGDSLHVRTASIELKKSAN